VVATSRLRPLRVRDVVEDATVVEQPQRLSCGDQDRRRIGTDHAGLGVTDERGRLVQVHPGAFAQPVARPAALDRLPPEYGTQPADQSGDVLRWPARREVVPQHVDDEVEGCQLMMLDGEQGQKDASLAAADIYPGENDFAASHPERTDDTHRQGRR
jgi:hypothetical protein